MALQLTTFWIDSGPQAVSTDSVFGWRHKTEARDTLVLHNQSFGVQLAFLEPFYSHLTVGYHLRLFTALRFWNQYSCLLLVILFFIHRCESFIHEFFILLITYQR